MKKTLLVLMIVALFSTTFTQTFAAPDKPFDLLENGAGSSEKVPKGIENAWSIQKQIPLEISNVLATSTNASSTEISWDTNKDADSTVSYWLGTSTASGTTEIYSSSTTQSHSIELLELGDGQVYSYFVSSEDLYGNKATSSIGVFNSSGDIVSEPSNDFYGPRITDLSITPTTIASGGAVIFSVTAEDVNGIGNVVYDIRYPNGTYVLRPNCNFEGATSGTCTFTGSIDHGISPSLAGNYTIESIRAVDKHHNLATYFPGGAVFGTESGSHDLTIPIIKVGEFVEISNTELTTPSTSSSTVVVTWETNKDVSTSIHYGTSSGQYSFIQSGATTSPLHYQAILSGIEASSTYYAIIRAEDELGNEGSSQEFVINKGDAEKLSEILNNENISNLVDEVVSEISAFEDSHFISNGGATYWQGLETHDVIPEFDNPTAPTELDTKPSDIDLTWNDTTINLPSLMPFSVSVNVYGTLPCHGYIIYFSTKHSGSLFTKAIEYGCLLQSHDWRLITPPQF